MESRYNSKLYQHLKCAFIPISVIEMLVFLYLGGSSSVRLAFGAGGVGGLKVDIERETECGMLDVPCSETIF